VIHRPKPAPPRPEPPSAELRAKLRQRPFDPISPPSGKEA
jgi:hypothetical protein